MKWEYKIYVADNVASVADLNKIGADHWELVGIDAAEALQVIYYYFKRPVEEPTSDPIMD